MHWLRPEDGAEISYICGEYTIAPNRKPDTSSIMRAYHAYFGIKLADQDKGSAPHTVCKACNDTLRGWTNGFTMHPCFLCMWDSRDRITRRRTGLSERNWCLAKTGTSSTTAAHQARLNQAVHQGSGQEWWLLHLLVPGISRIVHGEVESWHLWRSSDPVAHQRSRVQKLNERSGTGNVEGICSGSEELSWQQ